nr:MAG TPA: hypothetical protein [Caudoviricetes sp.]
MVSTGYRLYLVAQFIDIWQVLDVSYSVIILPIPL